MEPTIVDGRALARLIQDDLAEQIPSTGVIPFHIIYVGSDPVIDNYLSYKERFAREIGVRTIIHRYPKDIDEQLLESEIRLIVKENEPTIIQLPLLDYLEAQKFLDMIPWQIDVDVLSRQGRERFATGESLLVPPVTASILEILAVYQCDIETSNIVIVGMGKLVGSPMAAWLDREEYHYKSITQTTPLKERSRLLREADILITGVGIPHMIKANELKPGVVVIDAGTSEDTGEIVGDVDPEVSEVASVMTPVPGGVGPLTIALLYRNVVTSYQEYVRLSSTI